jgi:hypothetical protein
VLDPNVAAAPANLPAPLNPNSLFDTPLAPVSSRATSAPPPSRGPLTAAELAARALKDVNSKARVPVFVDAEPANLRGRGAPSAEAHPGAQSFDSFEAFEARMLARRVEMESTWRREDRGKALSLVAGLAHGLAAAWSDGYSQAWLVVTDVLGDFADKVREYFASSAAGAESLRNWRVRVLGLPGLVQRLYLSVALHVELALDLDEVRAAACGAGGGLTSG